MSTRYPQFDFIREQKKNIKRGSLSKYFSLAHKKEIKGNLQTLTTIASLSTTSNNFDSLFRVFFIFPSRYLLAISLPLAYLALGGIYLPIFSVTKKFVFRAAISSNPTRQARPIKSRAKVLLIFLCCQSKKIVIKKQTGVSPSMPSLSRDLLLITPLQPLAEPSKCNQIF